jgi:hypothetical protein
MTSLRRGQMISWNACLRLAPEIRFFPGAPALTLAALALLLRMGLRVVTSLP